MATMGGSRHIKSLNAPRYFAVPRKESKYVVKPNAGRHSLEKSSALVLVLRKTGLSDRRSELNRMINGGEIKVNGETVREPKYPVGINDVVEIPGTKASYTIFISTNGRMLLNEGQTDSSSIYKVVGKYKAKGGRMMIRLHDGRILEGDREVMVNDSIKYRAGKIEKHIKMKEGSRCVVLEGEHVGTSGTIKSIKKGTKSIHPSLVVESEAGHEQFETLVSNVMVI